MSKTALITGSAKRIGKAIAEHLAFKGWQIAVHYNHSSKEAEELVSALNEEYPHNQFYSFKANLEYSEEVQNLISQVSDKFGDLELLINNASVFDKSYLIETSEDLFDQQLTVNFKTPFLLIRDFANICKKGNIINFVDTRISTNYSNFAAYSLSKKALWELTKMAALELSPRIRLNAIAPGVTLAPVDEDEAYLNKLAEQIPMKRPGGIEPILKSIDYILENDHLTGQLLYCDGGENLGENK